MSWRCRASISFRHANGETPTAALRLRMQKVHAVELRGVPRRAGAEGRR